MAAHSAQRALCIAQRLGEHRLFFDRITQHKGLEALRREKEGYRFGFAVGAALVSAAGKDKQSRPGGHVGKFGGRILDIAGEFAQTVWGEVKGEALHG